MNTIELFQKALRAYVPPSDQPAPAALDEPTVSEMASNFSNAVQKWASAGFPVVSAFTYAARSAQCDHCEFWDSSARLGLGKCSAPKCGCSKLKRFLKTEKCPLGKWPE